MENETDDNFSVEDFLMSSTPIPLCRCKTKFSSAFNETLESDYKSAHSVFFTNPKKSLSTIGTKGSSDSELSLPDSLTDDEVENTDQEENGDCRKNIDFEDEAATRTDISLNTEKTQSAGENGVYNTPWGSDQRLFGVEPNFRYCNFEGSLLTERTGEDSDIREKNQSLSESGACEASLKEKMMADVKLPDSQSCKFEENSNVWKNASRRLANKRNIETSNEERALKKNRSSKNISNKKNISSSMDLKRCQGGPMSLNVTSSKNRIMVQVNNDISPKSDPFCRKRQKVDKGIQTRENCVLDLVTKSAPPSPISHSKTARGIYKSSPKKEHKPLSYFYCKFKKNVSKSRKFGASNGILCEEAKDIFTPECQQEIAAKSFESYENNKVDNDLLISTSKNVARDKELARNPFVTWVRKEENQDTFESQTSKTDLSCLFPNQPVQNDLATERGEILREKSVTMQEIYALPSKDSSLGLKIHNHSDLCSVVNETIFDSRNSDIEGKLNSLSTSKTLNYSDEVGNFDSEAATGNTKLNESLVGNYIYETICEKDEIIPEIVPDLQYFKSNEKSFTGLKSGSSDIWGKDEKFYKNDIYKTSFRSFKSEENLLSEQTTENLNVLESVHHRLTDKPNIEALHEECTMEEDDISERCSNKTNTSPFYLRRFQKSPIPLNMPLKLQKVSQSNHASPKFSPPIASNRLSCEKTKETFQPESLQKIADKSSKTLGSNKDNYDLLMHTNKSLTSDEELTYHPLATNVEREENPDTFESKKTDLSCFSSHWATSADSFPRVQNSPVPEGNEILRENTVNMRENRVLASKDASVELKENNIHNSFSVTDKTKLGSKGTDLKFPFKSNSLCSFTERSHPGYFDPQESTVNSITNYSFSSNLIICPFCKKKLTDVSPSKSNLMEMTNDNENNKPTKEHRPSVDVILDLLNIDNTISKNILLAILSKNPSNGASYTEIITYLKKKRVFKTEYSECVKIFLQTAVNTNVLEMKRRRYFVVSRERAEGSSFIETSAKKKIFTRKTRRSSKKDEQ